MGLYVIDAPHTEEECARAGVEFEKHPRAREILEKTVWGCGSGEHRAWTVTEFGSEDEAKTLVPAEFRGKATIYPVEVFTFNQMMEAHQ